jgi:hypothetical protein
MAFSQVLIRGPEVAIAPSQSNMRGYVLEAVDTGVGCMWSIIEEGSYDS